MFFEGELDTRRRRLGPEDPHRQYVQGKDSVERCAGRQARRVFPASLADEYYAGASLLDLSRRHDCNPSSIRYALIKRGVRMRAQGCTSRQRKFHSNGGKGGWK